MAAQPPTSQPAGPPSFDSWVSARASALTRFAYVLTGSLDEADDVVQEVLASAYGRWHRLAAAGQLESRLQAMVARRYVGRTRRWGADAGRFDYDEQPWLPTPSDAAGPGVDATMIWQRCAGLPRRQRAALVLCCYEGLGAAEIARVVGGREKSAHGALVEAAAHAVPASGYGHAMRLRAVRSALQEYAEHAPPVYSPAERAVIRSRRRRRRRIATSGTLAAALTVPAVWALGAGDGTPVQPPTPPPTPRLDPSPVDLRGWRWESWGGIQVQVPGSWGHGNLTQWCVRRGPDGPSVDRPELVSTRAMCSLDDDGRPTYTGGLVLRRSVDGLRLSRADVAPYATTRIHTVGGVTLTVIDIDPAVGSAILASAEVIGRRDFNGCEPRRARRRPSLGATRAPAGPLTHIGSVTSVSVCRYGLVGWSRPTLISSRRLSGERADAVLDALRAAPVQPLAALPGRCRTAAREFAVLELWRPGDPGGPSSFVVRYDGCHGHGVDDGLSTRGLTAGVLDSILVPPWTGHMTAQLPPTRPAE